MGELIVVLIIILVLFGAKRLPEIGRALAKAIKEFKTAGKEIEEDIKEGIKDNNGDHKS
jgi:sec-independent protein translocase protein TatA